MDVFCVWDCGFPWSYIQKLVAFIVFDPFAELLITVAIAINTLFMALDHYGLKENVSMAATLKVGNTVLTVNIWKYKVIWSWCFTKSDCSIFFSKSSEFSGIFYHFHNWMWNEIDCDESKILFSRGVEYFWFHNWLVKFKFEEQISK